MHYCWVLRWEETARIESFGLAKWIMLKTCFNSLGWIGVCRLILHLKWEYCCLKIRVLRVRRKKKKWQRVLYYSAAGKLMCTMVCTRPDLAHAVAAVSGLWHTVKLYSEVSIHELQIWYDNVSKIWCSCFHTCAILFFIVLVIVSSMNGFMWDLLFLISSGSGSVQLFSFFLHPDFCEEKDNYIRMD